MKASHCILVSSFLVLGILLSLLSYDFFTLSHGERFIIVFTLRIIYRVCMGCKVWFSIFSSIVITSFWQSLPLLQFGSECHFDPHRHHLPHGLHSDNPWSHCSCSSEETSVSLWSQLPRFPCASVVTAESSFTDKAGAVSTFLSGRACHLKPPFSEGFPSDWDVFLLENLELCFFLVLFELLQWCSWYLV